MQNSKDRYNPPALRDVISMPNIGRAQPRSEQYYKPKSSMKKKNQFDVKQNERYFVNRHDRPWTSQVSEVKDY
jgi:hypothetical protein